MYKLSILLSLDPDFSYSRVCNFILAITLHNTMVLCLSALDHVASYTSVNVTYLRFFNRLSMIHNTFFIVTVSLRREALLLTKMIVNFHHSEPSYTDTRISNLMT